MSAARPLARFLRRLASAAVGLLPVALLDAGPATAATLDDIRARGYVLCGVSESKAGFSRVDERGVWSGLEIDFCGAVAAAAMGRRDAVKFRPLTESNRFQALKDGEIDVLARATTWTLSRDTELGVRFVGTLFNDGQGFLVRKSQGMSSVLELSGASICVMVGTNAEQGLNDYFRSRGMRYQRVPADRWEDLLKIYADGGCMLLTGDMSMLAYERSRMAKPGDHMLLPELITKEPLGPAVRLGDDQWFGIVRWTLFALIAAEELALTRENVDDRKSSPLTDVRRFLGLDANLGQAMGLDAEWAYRIVKQVGNYGEIYDRNVGAGTVLGLDRGDNDLWTDGGLMYAPPLR